MNTVGGKIIKNAVFAARADQVAKIRATVQGVVRNHDERDTIVLLADELATNAVLHTGSEHLGLIIAKAPGGGLRFAIADQHRTPSFPQPPAPAAGKPGHATDPDRLDLAHEHGRGLFLLDALTRRWGIVCEHGLLFVWFDVP